MKRQPQCTVPSSGAVLYHSAGDFFHAKNRFRCSSQFFGLGLVGRLPSRLLSERQRTTQEALTPSGFYERISSSIIRFIG